MTATFADYGPKRELDTELFQLVYELLADTSCFIIKSSTVARAISS